MNLTDAKARAVVWTVAGIIGVGLLILAARTWGMGAIIVINTALSLVAVWIAESANRRADEAIDEALQARGPIAPVIDEPWRDAEPVELAPVETLKATPYPRTPIGPVPMKTTISARAYEPKTQPIEVQPATVPTNRVIDDWETRMQADYEAALTRIREATA